MLPREGEGSLSSSRLLRPATPPGDPCQHYAELKVPAWAPSPAVSAHLPLMTGWLESEEKHCVLIFLSLTVFRARTKLWKGPPI